jgi:hypothetical protein
MYCGSVSRGKGCRYGPHGVHFHPDDSTKCSYCGSPSFGRGCKVNPINDLHVHGVTYNNMFRENIQSFFDNKILIKELKKPFTKFEAYRLGIINEQGNKIKTPITEEEINSFSPLIRTIVRLKRFIGAKTDLIDVADSLKEASTSNKILCEAHYSTYVKHKDNVADIVNKLYEALDEARRDGLTLEEAVSLIKA